jgi:S1-C subfamily serine protease
MHSPADAPQPSRSRTKSWYYWALGGALIGVLLGLLWTLNGNARPGLNPQAAARKITPRGDLDPDEKKTIALFRQLSPSVVYITTIARRRDVFSLNQFEIPQGSGSGFIWDQDGHIITNFHVLQGASGAKVTLADHSEWDAQLLGVAPDHDLAVLSIEAPARQLPPIPIGTSADLQVGQRVYAIGNPFGLDQTLTTGIISALGREITSVTNRTITGVIQTDAAINPGNSGGPLLDSAGRLIGVNTAIYSSSGANAGIGFAVPVDTVNRIVPQLLRSGQIVRPGVGVRIADDATANRLGVRGVLIIQVDPSSAAAAAGLRGTRRNEQGRLILGDIIVGIDAREVNSVGDLQDALDQHAVGDKVQVAILRDNRRLTVPIVLQALQ